MSADADGYEQMTLGYSSGISWTIPFYDYSEARLHQLTMAYWSQHPRIRFLRELAPDSTVIELCADHGDLGPARSVHLPDRGDLEIRACKVAVEDLDSAESLLSQAAAPRRIDAAALVH
jgi:hypothetical protein